MTLIGILLFIFNILLWTVVRETLIERNKKSQGWCFSVVVGCYMVTLTSIFLFA